jgi:hypothetical protein
MRNTLLGNGKNGIKTPPEQGILNKYAHVKQGILNENDIQNNAASIKIP